MRLLLTLLSLSVIGANAGAGELITCQVRNGQAIAYYCNQGGGGSASGKVNIEIYNQDGYDIHSDFCVGIANAINGCSELCTVSASDDAASCGASMGE